MMQGPNLRPRRAGLGLGLALVAFAAIGPISAASASVDQASPPVVAQAIGGTGGSGSTPSDPTQYGTGNSAIAGFPTAAPLFGVLSSGSVESADAPNDSDSESTGFGNQDAARGDAFDPVTLKVDFVAPGDLNCLNMDYRFFSEEFPEYVNSGFNDAFIAELDTTTWSLAPDPSTGTTSITAPDDFAAGYGDRVSVDTVGPTIVTPDNAVGTTYDAGTGTLIAKTPVTPGPHSIYLSVFDSGDSIYDSAVFADNLRFTSESAKQCQPTDLFAGATGIDPASKVSFNGGTGSVTLECTLPLGATDPCVGKLSVSVTGGGSGKLAAKKGLKVAKGKYSIPPASSGKGKLKLTKKGKRFFKENSKAKGKLKVKNTVNGTSSNSKVKIKG